MTEARSYAPEDLEWEQVEPKLRRQAFHGERMTMTRYSFGPSGRFPHHVHPQEQVAFLVSGTITFTIEGVDHHLTAGSLVVIPPDVPHSAAAGESGAEIFSVVAPGRSAGDAIEILEEP